ncbi:hypothetical protein [Breoghania sp. JC706]|uniref:hypothetical protein n=1 Tax=Breoghania sp. JC706 TaxID=3117732 RepID=UPI0030080BD4
MPISAGAACSAGMALAAGSADDKSGPRQAPASERRLLRTRVQASARLELSPPTDEIVAASLEKPLHFNLFGCPVANPQSGEAQTAAGGEATDLLAIFNLLAQWTTGSATWAPTAWAPTTLGPGTGAPGSGEAVTGGTATVHTPSPEDLRSGRPTALLVPPGAAAFALGWAVLDASRNAIRDEAAASLPCTTLITARDVVTIAWLAAKIIAYALGRAREAPAGRYRILSPQRTASRWAALDDNADGTGHLLAWSSLSGAEGARLAGEACDVLITNTHGLDACADGGDGLVLCGLQQNRETLLADGDAPAPQAGILACGHGHPCPRGPHPYPLARLNAQTLVLLSCNGFRPGTGNLDAGFNLGLAFLDGRGAGYCSSPFSNIGGRLAAAAMGSAFASGEPFGSAISRGNCALLTSGIEDVSLLGIGDPGDTKPRPGVHANGALRVTAEHFPLQLQAAERFVAEVEIRDPRLIERARAGLLGWSVDNTREGDGCQPVLWDQRVERDGARERLVLRLYRFPDTLSDHSLAPVDLEDLAARIRAAFAALDRWQELWRLLGFDDETVTSAIDEIARMRGPMSGRCSALLGQCRYDGGAPRAVSELLEMAHATGAHARDLVMNTMLPHLCKPVWLTNVLSQEYFASAISAGQCDYCGERAISKRLRHPLTGQERDVLICSQCGIVMDGHVGGAIERIDIQGDRRARPGSPLTVRLALRCAPASAFARGGAGEDIRVAPRLSIIGQQDVVPQPEVATWSGAPVSFRFDIPANLPPHRYFIKVLAASSQEIAFASRPFFVV